MIRFSLVKLLLKAARFKRTFARKMQQSFTWPTKPSFTRPTTPSFPNAPVGNLDVGRSGFPTETFGNDGVCAQHRLKAGFPLTGHSAKLCGNNGLPSYRGLLKSVCGLIFSFPAMLSIAAPTQVPLKLEPLKSISPTAKATSTYI